MEKRKWNNQEIEYLKDNYSRIKSEVICKIIKRTIPSIRNKAKELKITKKISFWDKNDINFLIENYKKLSTKELSIRLNRNIYSIKNKIFSLSLKKGYKSWNKGLTKESDERVRKRAEKIVNFGLLADKNHHFFGKKFSQQHIEKLRKSHIGQVPYNKGKKSPEISKGKIGHLVSLETKEKLRIKNRGKHFSTRTEFKKGDIRILGKNNPNFNNYSSFEPYGIEFNIQLKNIIRKRDNQICMNCGVHRERLKTALNIHHINYDKRCNLEQNLISLCCKCHPLTNFNRDYWKKLFQNKMSKLYNYKYSQNGDIILEVNNEKNIN